MSGLLSSHRARRRPGGMSLIELLIALVLLSIMGAVIGMLLLSTQRSHDAIREQNTMQKVAQRTADTVMDGLRGAQEITAGSDTLVAASFENGDTVAYYLDGGRLKRDRHISATGYTSIGELLCDHVAALDFNYYTESGAMAPAPAVAQSVAVSLRIADGREGATETSSVRLRNKHSS